MHNEITNSNTRENKKSKIFKIIYLLLLVLGALLLLELLDGLEVEPLVFVGCGIIVISSLIFNDFIWSAGLFDGDEVVGVLGPFLSMTRFATTLCAEYTWFSNCLYMPKVAVHTVHLYDKWAGFRVMLWSRATWLSSFHWYTYKKKHDMK